MDSAVSPIGVLVGEADDPPADLGVDRWTTSILGGRLGPVECDESVVPLDHGFGSDNQECQSSAWPIDSVAQKRKDRPVGLVEFRAVDLALQYEDLVSKGEDLCVAGVA